VDDTAARTDAYQPPADPKRVSSAAEALAPAKTGANFDGTGYTSAPG
jgi:hypothetical protein